MKLEKYKYHLSNLRCFGPETQTIDAIYPVNLIIGKNNIGKSTLLDAIESFCVGKLYFEAGVTPLLSYSFSVDEKALESISNDEYRVKIPTGFYRFAKPKDTLLSFKGNIQIIGHLGNDRTSLETSFRTTTELEVHKKSLIDTFAQPLRNANRYDLKGKRVVRIAAERSIYSEKEDGNVEITSSGEKLTSTLQAISSYQDYDPDLVEKHFLKSVNEIVQPDFTLENVRIAKDKETETHTITFQVGGKWIPITRMGSGLKPIMLVLAHMELLPIVNQCDLSNTVFLFEELENNLHPSILRRLFAHIQKKAADTKAIFFITTHSNLVIDFFGDDDEAQILHVAKNGENTELIRVDDHLKKCGVLDDLGNRASDILQCNGGIWVEGPSDVIYFNKWIELWTEEKLKPGIHYQCVQYGGSNIASLELKSGDGETDEEEKVTTERLTNGLLVNRNFIVICDRDRESLNKKLKEDVERIIEESKKLTGIVWVTDGREVENYLPIECVRLAAQPLKKSASPVTIAQVPLFESVFRLVCTTGRKWEKIQLAESCVTSKHFTKENLKTVTGLADWLDKCVIEIKRWNGMS